MKSDPDEAQRLQEQFQHCRHSSHHGSCSHPCNFALASADAHDWPQAIARLKEAITACGQCDSLAQLHKDLGLIYCHSGDYKNGRTELLAAQKMSPADEDIKKALDLLQQARLANSVLRHNRGRVRGANFIPPRLLHATGFLS